MATTFSPGFVDDAYNPMMMNGIPEAGIESWKPLTSAYVFPSENTHSCPEFAVPAQASFVTALPQPSMMVIPGGDISLAATAAATAANIADGALAAVPASGSKVVMPQHYYYYDYYYYYNTSEMRFPYDMSFDTSPPTADPMSSAPPPPSTKPPPHLVSIPRQPEPKTPSLFDAASPLPSTPSLVSYCTSPNTASLSISPPTPPIASASTSSTNPNPFPKPRRIRPRPTFAQRVSLQQLVHHLGCTSRSARTREQIERYWLPTAAPGLNIDQVMKYVDRAGRAKYPTPRMREEAMIRWLSFCLQAEEEEERKSSESRA